MPHSERILAQLLAVLTRATRTRRVLEIGTGRGVSGLAIAAGLPEDGMLITLERDTEAAIAARQTFAAAGHETKVSVMAGEASRYLHKIAGPFDMVLQDGDPAEFAALHDRLVRLLAPAATLITHNVTQAGSYNEMLTGDRRLLTTILNVNGGIAVSVRRENEL